MGSIFSVIGQMTLDEYFVVDSIPPPGEKSLVSREHRFYGGAHVNFAVAAVRLGTRVHGVGCYGTDPDSLKSLEVLNNEGVDTTHLVRTDAQVLMRCIITLDRNAERSILVAPPADHHLVGGYTSEMLASTRPSPEDLVYYGVLSEHIEDFVHATDHMDVKRAVTLDAIPELDSLTTLLGRMDVVFCSNESYAANRAIVEDALARGLKNVVVTSGRDGSALYSVDGTTYRAAARNVDAPVVDTTGAGDSFAAAFCNGWLKGMWGEELLSYANAAASLSVREFGPQGGPTAAVLNSFLASAPVDNAGHV